MVSTSSTIPALHARKKGKPNISTFLLIYVWLSIITPPLPTTVMQPLVCEYHFGSDVDFETTVWVVLFPLVQPDPLVSYMIGHCRTPSLVQRVVGILPAWPSEVDSVSFKAVATRRFVRA